MSRNTTEKQVKFPRKLNSDGTPNKHYIDLTNDIDKPLKGQNYGVFSFVSPDHIIKKKELFFFEAFIKNWEMSKSMEKFGQFLNFIAFKYKISADTLTKDFEEFTKEEEAEIRKSTMDDDYKTFVEKNNDALTENYEKKHGFQTNVRGMKARGVFATEEEARQRAKFLRDNDADFCTFIAPMNTWLPIDIEAYMIGEVQYLEEELNQLMHEKAKNEISAKNEFEYRVKESKKKAIEENMKKAEKNNIVLTQNISPDGTLFSTRNTHEIDILKSNPDKEITSADIRRHLLESEDIVTTTGAKNDHGQSQLISGPFATARL